MRAGTYPCASTVVELRGPKIPWHSTTQPRSHPRRRYVASHRASRTTVERVCKRASARDAERTMSVPGYVVAGVVSRAYSCC